MPLDRRLKLQIDTVTRDRFGDPTTTTEERGIWATLVQDDVARSLAAEGAYGLARRVYRIRFGADIVAALEAGNEVRLVDGTDSMVVAGAGEPARADRRRFLDLAISE